MIVLLVVLFGSLLLFRGLGFCGILFLASWRDSTAFALAVMFCFTGLAHFGRMRSDLEKMMPPWVRNPSAAIYWTGILEILGAIGLAIPVSRRLAGLLSGPLSDCGLSGKYPCRSLCREVGRKTGYTFMDSWANPAVIHLADRLGHLLISLNVDPFLERVRANHGKWETSD
jgi:hypothetical protein